MLEFATVAGIEWEMTVEIAAWSWFLKVASKLTSLVDFEKS